MLLCGRYIVFYQRKFRRDNRTGRRLHVKLSRRGTSKERSFLVVRSQV
jgi:hypothetical protein